MPHAYYIMNIKWRQYCIRMSFVIINLATFFYATLAISRPHSAALGFLIYMYITYTADIRLSAKSLVSIVHRFLSWTPQTNRCL